MWCDIVCDVMSYTRQVMIDVEYAWCRMWHNVIYDMMSYMTKCLFCKLNLFAWGRIRPRLIELLGCWLFQARRNAVWCKLPWEVVRCEIEWASNLLKLMSTARRILVESCKVWISSIWGLWLRTSYSTMVVCNIVSKAGHEWNSLDRTIVTYHWVWIVVNYDLKSSAKTWANFLLVSLGSTIVRVPVSFGV